MLKIRYVHIPDYKSEDMDDKDSIEIDAPLYFHEDDTDELYYYEEEFIISSDSGGAAPSCSFVRTRVLHKT